MNLQYSPLQPPLGAYGEHGCVRRSLHQVCSLSRGFDPRCLQNAARTEIGISEVHTGAATAGNCMIAGGLSHEHSTSTPARKSAELHFSRSAFTSPSTDERWDEYGLVCIVNVVLVKPIIKPGYCFTKLARGRPPNT